MATKTLTITEEAYEKLAAFKKGKESFSDVIHKLTSKYSMLDLVGLLSKEEANELAGNIKDIGKRLKKQLDKTDLKLQYFLILLL